MAWLVHNGKQYYVAYREAKNRKVHYLAAGPNKRKAIVMRDDIAHRARLARIGGSVIPEPVLFADHLDKWFASRIVEPTTRLRDTGVIEKYLRPALGHRLLGDLKPEDFASLAATVTKKTSIHTARRTLAVASAALSDAVENRLIPTNPVRIPPRPKSLYEPISLNLLCAVVAATPEPWRPFVFFLLLTGCRFGEAIAITWNDIDFKEKKVRVRKQKPTHLYGEEGRRLKPPKSEAGIRSIDMLPPLKRMLMDLPQYGEAALVFPAQRGGHINYHFFMDEVWKPIVNTLGLLGKQRKPHMLRHGFGSLLLAWGEDIMYVSAQLGHSSRTFTLETYAHEIKERRRLPKQTTLANLEAAFRGKLAYKWLTESRSGVRPPQEEVQKA